MKIKFENVGRNNATWVADYPSNVSLEAACENDAWWDRQLRGKLLSRDVMPLYDEEKDRVVIFAGFHAVGEARLVQEGEQ